MYLPSTGARGASRGAAAAQACRRSDRVLTPARADTSRAPSRRARWRRPVHCPLLARGIGFPDEPSGVRQHRRLCARRLDVLAAGRLDILTTRRLHVLAAGGLDVLAACRRNRTRRLRRCRRLSLQHVLSTVILESAVAIAVPQLSWRQIRLVAMSCRPGCFAHRHAGARFPGRQDPTGAHVERYQVRGRANEVNGHGSLIEVPRLAD